MVIVTTIAPIALAILMLGLGASLTFQDFLRLNEKKQYILTGFNVQRVLPYQKLIFKNKAKFIRKVLNLLTIS